MDASRVTASGGTRTDEEYELTDIEPEEVSFVDRAANRKKHFHIIKREGEMTIKLTQQRKEALKKTLDEIQGRVTHLSQAVEAAAVVEKEDEEALDEVKTLMQAMYEIALPFVSTGGQAPQTQDPAAVTAPPTAKADGDGDPATAAPPAPAAQAPAAGAAPDPAPAATDAPPATDDGEDMKKRLAETEEKLRDVTAGYLDLMRKMLSAGISPEPPDPTSNYPNAGAGTQPDKGSAVPGAQAMKDVPGLAELMKRIEELEKQLAEAQKQATSKAAPKAPIAGQSSTPDTPTPPAKRTSWPYDMNTRDRFEKQYPEWYGKGGK